MGRLVYWEGTPPDNCEVCKDPITERFVDGATKFGPWAKMCPKCHKEHGLGLGTGVGQEFLHLPSGRWLKVNGQA